MVRIAGLRLRSPRRIGPSIRVPPILGSDLVKVAVLRVGSGFVLRLRTETSQVHQVLCEVLGQAYSV
jgi:hypothetical protein